MLKNIKARYVWILIAVLFLVAIGLIFAILNAPNGANQALTIILVIVFILITFLVQFATYKTFSARQAKKMNYPTKTFKTEENLSEKLLDLKYKKSERGYCDSYLKIENKIAYKVVLINDIEKYYNHDEEAYEADKRLDSCKAMIGIEIFNEVSVDALKKIPDYSFEVKNIYYTALVLKEDGTYVCLNYIEPNEYHKEYVSKVFNDLGLTELTLNN